jgi:hypothetical protein
VGGNAMLDGRSKNGKASKSRRPDSLDAADEFLDVELVAVKREDISVRLEDSQEFAAPLWMARGETRAWRAGPSVASPSK